MEAYHLVPAPDAARCLVCGLDREHGYNVRFRVDGDTVVGAWTATAALEGWGGLVHGSAFAALHDDAAHWAMNVLVGQIGVTTRMDVRFQRPIRIGDRVTATGRVASVDARRGAFATEIRHADGAVASTAVTEYMFVEDPALLARLLGRPVSPMAVELLAAPPEKRREMILERSRRITAAGRA
ncbi:MAG TPA: hotdog fold domain-containing protein [Candidatus Thermoplasmatota archaeon]|nr:hotdog fold domain-containing protein [Candidatus Thermoplasmatota archaeon]